MNRDPTRVTTEGMHVLAIDLGGTKVRVANVGDSGKLDKVIEEPTDLTRGPRGLTAQLVKMLTEVSGGRIDASCIGIGSAGPLDPAAGELLNPTNFKTRGKPWGRFALTASLEEELRVPVVLENDAAAAAMGEGWLGASKDVENSVMLTLGTGLGVGVIANGKIVRAGRGLHPEAGHIFLRAGAREALCGCGVYGCAEAYLSATHFAKRVSAKLKRTLTAEQIVKLGKTGVVKKAFREYAHDLALAMHTYVVCFAPEMIVLSGGFAQAASRYLPDAKKDLKELLRGRRTGVDMLPKVVTSRLGKDAVLYGAAGIAMHAAA